jgi:hypothetical protein
MIVEYEFLSYVDIVICIGPYPILETWPPIYRGQGDGVGQIESKPSWTPKFTFDIHLFRLTITFEFIRRPIPPILSPSSRTFVELTLVKWCHVNVDYMILHHLWV